MTLPIIIACAIVASLALFAFLVVFGRKLMRPRERIPGFNTRTRANPYPPEDIAGVLRDFVDGWHARGWSGADKLSAALDELDLYFVPGASFDTRFGKAAGVTESRWRITLCGPPSYPHVRDCALPHELMHWGLFVTRGSMAAGHRHDPSGLWTPEIEAFVMDLRRAR